MMTVQAQKGHTEPGYKEDDNIFQVILEDALAGYWDWNIAEGTEYFSPTFKAMFGYTDDEIADRPESWQRIIHPGDLPKVWVAYEAHVKSRGAEPFQLEVRYFHKNGRLLWILCSGRVIKWSSNGEPLRMVGSHRDISSRKNAEQELRVSETRFKDAFEYSAIGMALVSKDGHWLKVNKRLCEMLGYTSEQLLQKTFQEITHPEDLDLDLRYLQMMLSGEIETYKMEKRYFHKDGNILWVLLSVSLVKDTRGEGLYFVSQIEDISQRKLAEDELKRVNLELKEILDASTQVAIIATDSMGTITHFNSGAENLLGYPAHEVLGKKSLLKFHSAGEIKEYAGKLSPLFDKRLSGFNALVAHAKRGDYDSRQWKYVRKNKTTFSVEQVITTMRHTNGEIAGFLAVAIDISEIVRKKNELIQAKEEQETLNRKLKFQNRQLEDFAQITSHNLRAPVSNLSSLLMMHNLLEDPKEKKALFTKFSTVIAHLTETLGDLAQSLRITENPEVPKVDLDFKQVLKKTKETLAGEIMTSDAQISGDFKRAPYIYYNRIYLESIFLNLVSNAIKYGPPGRQPRILIKSWHEAGEPKMSITDNGLGINMQRQGHKLFGLHKTFHRNPEAKGVGLFMTKAQVESQGGEISTTSTEGKGSTFTIVFNKRLK